LDGATERFKPAHGAPRAAIHVTDRRLGLLAGFLVLLAGCAGSPPPATGGPTGVTLSALAANAMPGGEVSYVWEIQGAAENVSHSELHFGPNAIADPAQGVYASTVAGLAQSGGRYAAQATMPAEGLLHARAHVIAGGKTLWSNEVTVRPGGATFTFTDVQLPAEAEAGVPFTLTYRVQGAGSSSHVGAHFSSVSSATLAEHFAAADWQGQRASQHVASATFPQAVSVGVTLPSPGTWYLRPHAIVGSENWWGQERMVNATNPGQPNIVLLDAPTTSVAGTPIRVVFQLNAQPGTSNHVGAHYSQQSANLTSSDTVAAWPGARTAPHAGLTQAVDVPAPFAVNINFPLPGTWHYRAHAIIAGQQVWSSEVAMNATWPDAPRVFIMSAPTNYTITLDPTSTRVDTVDVEWAVVGTQPNLTQHTHLHHGPASVANPHEGGAPGSGYPQATTVQNGTTPALFRANLTLTAGPNQVYYLRAMAILPDPEGGAPIEVWSDEWPIAVNVRTV
jgi:hypothetical protein